MFGRIAPGYDKANRLLSGGADILWRKRLVRSVERDLPRTGPRRVLDLAAGTLDVSLDLARQVPGAQILAVDFCPPMLVEGRRKLDRQSAFLRGRIRAAAGDAVNLPLADGCVQAVTVAFGLRNMPRAGALSEAWRVLAPGGSLHVLEFGSARRTIWGGLYNFYLGRVLPLLGGLITGQRSAYSYLASSVAAFPEADALGREMAGAGFQDVRWERIWGGIVYLHSGRKCGTSHALTNLQPTGEHHAD